MTPTPQDPLAELETALAMPHSLPMERVDRESALRAAAARVREAMGDKATMNEIERLQYEQDRLCALLSNGCQRHDIHRRVESLLDILSAAEDALPEGFRVEREHNLAECIEDLVENRTAWQERALKHHKDYDAARAELAELKAKHQEVVLAAAEPAAKAFLEVVCRRAVTKLVQEDPELSQGLVADLSAARAALATALALLGELRLEDGAPYLCCASGASVKDWIARRDVAVGSPTQQTESHERP